MERKNFMSKGGTMDVAIGFGAVGIFALIVTGILILRYEDRDTKKVNENLTSVYDRIDSVEKTLASMALEKSNEAGNFNAEMQELRNETAKIKEQRNTPQPVSLTFPKAVPVSIVEILHQPEAPFKRRILPKDH
jgi:hypothetical protein